MSNADLRIWFPPESTTIRNMPCIRPEELEIARAVLGLSFDKPGLEVELGRREPGYPGGGGAGGAAGDGNIQRLVVAGGMAAGALPRRLQI